MIYPGVTILVIAMVTNMIATSSVVGLSVSDSPNTQDLPGLSDLDVPVIFFRPLGDIKAYPDILDIKYSCSSSLLTIINLK